MRITTIFGVLLVLFGMAALIWKGIEYTTEETLIDAGPIEVQAEEERTIPIGPVVGVVAVVGGIILLGMGRKT